MFDKFTATMSNTITEQYMRLRCITDTVREQLNRAIRQTVCEWDDVDMMPGNLQCRVSILQCT